MKERRGGGRFDEASLANDHEAPGAGPRQRPHSWWDDLQTEFDAATADEQERLRKLGLYRLVVPEERARLLASAPAKITQVELHLAREELQRGAMSPESALVYVRWLLDEQRGWGPGSEQHGQGRREQHEGHGERNIAEERDGRGPGALASAFGFLTRALRFEDFLARGLDEVVRVVTTLGRPTLTNATRLAAADGLSVPRKQPATDSLARIGHKLTPSANAASPPEMEPQHGAAMWRVAERRAATLYRRAIDSGELADERPEIELALRRSGSGLPLPSPVKQTMEHKLGVPLDRVRIHTDRLAAEATEAMRAEAFTVGEDIFFAAGAFSPGSAEGERLLVHELTHVVQAWQGRTGAAAPGAHDRVSRPGDALELEAEAVAERVGRGERAVFAGTGQVVGREPAPAAGPTPSLTRDRQAAPEAALEAAPAATPMPTQAPSPAPRHAPSLAPPMAQPVLRRPTGAPDPGRPRSAVPQVRGGSRAAPKSKRAQQELRGISAEFIQRAHQATANAGDKLHQGISSTRSRPPGDGAKTQAASALHAARSSEQEARSAESKHRAKADARAVPVNDSTVVGPGKREEIAAHGPIQLKQIDDWSKYMPEALPDQDERERQRIEQLVKKKIQGERHQVQQGFEQLRAAHLQKSGEVRAMQPKLQAQIDRAQRQALGQVSSSEATQRGAVQRHVAAVQGQVNAHAAAMKGRVTQAHTAALAKINAAHKVASVKLSKSKAKALDEVKGAEALALLTLALDFLGLKGRFTTLGASKAGDAITVGEEESGRMSGKWDGEKLEAAQKAAHETADGFASSMTEQAAGALGEIEAKRPEAEQSLRDLATATRQGVERSFQATQDALDAAKESSIQAANSAHKAALSQIDQANASATASLRAHGASQIAAIAKQAHGARSSITAAGRAAQSSVAQACNQSADGIARGVLGLVRAAQQLEAPDPGDTQRQVQESAQALGRGAADVCQGLGRTASGQSSGLLQQAQTSAESMAAVASAAVAAATQLGNGAKQKMTGIAQSTGDSLGQLSEAHKTSADEKVKAAESGFTEQVKALRDSYKSAATDRATEFDSNYNQCADALRQAVPDRGGGAGRGGSGKQEKGGGEGEGGAAKDEISSIQENAQKAADAVKPWWQKALAVVVSIVVAVVVVIVVTALIVTTGPVGAILVGAAAGALGSVAGTMASNLVLGNGVFDGITLQSVLIGAIGGGLAAGLTAGVGAGAGVLANSTRFAGTALGRGAQATTTALGSGTAGGLTQFAIKSGVGIGTDFVSEQTANLIVNGKLDISVENVLLSVITNAATSHPRFDAFQTTVQAGIQAHTPIRVDLPRLQIQIGNPQAGGGATGSGGTGSGASSSTAGGGSGASSSTAGGGSGATSSTGGGPDAGPASNAGGPRGASDGAGTPPATGESGRPAGSPATDGRAPGGTPDSGSGGGVPAGPDRMPGPTGTDSGAKTDGRGPRPPDEGGAGTKDNAGGARDGGARDGGAPKNGDAQKPDGPAATHDPGGARDGGARDGGAPKNGDAQKPDGPAATHDPGGARQDGAGNQGDGTQDIAPTRGEGDSAAGDSLPPDGPTSDGPASDGPTNEGGDGPSAATRDSQLDDVGYPQGTTSKAQELAAKIEQDGQPSKDQLRDTEANQRGARELQQLLEDPALSPEARARLQRELATRLRELPEPTGDLSRDVREVRDHQTKNQDGELSQDPAGAKETPPPADESPNTELPKGQVTGGKYGTTDESMEMLTDPAPTEEVRLMQEEAKRRYPGDEEAQMDFLWKQQAKLRQSILTRRDASIPDVSRALAEFGVKLTPETVTKVFDYLFSSAGLAFHYPNYQAWMRLATGQGTVADARFMVHESHEIGLMEQAGVDFMGDGLTPNTPQHDAWYNGTFEPAYMAAHRQALRAEYEFLVGQVAKATGDAVHLSPEELAAIDPTSSEGRDYMQGSDGKDIKEHVDFKAWTQRANEVVTLPPATARLLGLSSPEIKLGDLIRLIRNTKMSDLSTLASE